jgi:acylphosphatase
MYRIHIVIRGKVQGVGFRYHAQAKARSLGILGWVRNLKDGTVELVAEGEQVAISNFETWCAHGPPAARVDEITRFPVEDGEKESFFQFEIRTQ